MQLRRNIYLSLIVAGKLDQKDYQHLLEVNEVHPRFGRNWWYNKPKLRKTNLGWSLHIMCFNLDYADYRKVGFK